MSANSASLLQVDPLPIYERTATSPPSYQQSLLITNTDTLIEQYANYVRRHLYQATSIVTGDNFTCDVDGRLISCLGDRWHTLSGSAIAEAYSLTEERINAEWRALPLGRATIDEDNRGTVISEYRRHVQRLAPLFLARVIDEDFDRLAAILMPEQEEQVPAVIPLFNNPWSQEFSKAAVYDAAERLRGEQFEFSNHNVGSWEVASGEIVSATYNLENKFCRELWSTTLFEGAVHYSTVYKKINRAVRDAFIHLVEQEISRGRTEFMGSTLRTLSESPTPPNSSASRSSGSLESPCSVASGYDPTSDMDISPDCIGY